MAEFKLERTRFSDDLQMMAGVRSRLTRKEADRMMAVAGTTDYVEYHKRTTRVLQKRNNPIELVHGTQPLRAGSPLIESYQDHLKTDRAQDREGIKAEITRLKSLPDTPVSQVTAGSLRSWLNDPDFKDERYLHWLKRQPYVDHATAEDLLQEAKLSVLRSKEPADGFAKFLMTATQRRYQNWVQAQMAQKRTFERIAVSLEQVAPEGVIEGLWESAVESET